MQYVQQRDITANIKRHFDHYTILFPLDYQYCIII